MTASGSFRRSDSEAQRLKPGSCGGFIGTSGTRALSGLCSGSLLASVVRNFLFIVRRSSCLRGARTRGLKPASFCGLYAALKGRSSTDAGEFQGRQIPHPKIGFGMTTIEDSHREASAARTAKLSG